MRTSILLVFSILLSLNLFAQANFKTVASMDVFKKRLAEESATLETIESDFTQTKYMDMLSETIVSKGKFYYSKPDKICLNYTSPVKYLIVINGKKIKIVSDGKKNVYDIGSNKMMNQMNTLISACMTGNLNDLSSDYTVSLKESSVLYWIKVSPKGSVKSYLQDIDIYIDKKDMSVLRLRLTESTSDYTEYVFSNKKKNSTIKDEVFSIK